MELPEIKSKLELLISTFTDLIDEDKFLLEMASSCKDNMSIIELTQMISDVIIATTIFKILLNKTGQMEITEEGQLHIHFYDKPSKNTTDILTQNRNKCEFHDN